MKSATAFARSILTIGIALGGVTEDVLDRPAKPGFEPCAAGSLTRTVPATRRFSLP